MEEITQKELDNYQEPVYQKMTYGAPELKKLYKKFAFGGLILAIVLHAFLIASYAFSLYIDNLKKEESMQIKRNVELKDISSNQEDENEDENTPPPQIETVEQKVIQDLASLNPEPAAKEKAEITTLKAAEEQLKQDNTLRGREEKEGSDLPSDRLDKGKLQEVEKKIEKEEKKEVKDKEKVYKQFEVDKAPGAVNLGSVQSSMRYPEIAKSNGIEGRVSVTVLVGTDGSVLQVGSFSGPDVFRDEVSSKVMNLRFTPAIQQGNPVKCWVTVPFSFKLSQTGFKKEKEKEENKEEKKEE